MLREDKNVVIERLEGALTDSADNSEVSFRTREALAEDVSTWERIVGQWEELRRNPHADRAEAERQLQECNEELTRSRRRMEEPVVAVFRLDSKAHYVTLSEDDYQVHLAMQQVAPVLVTTWNGKRWWWYLDRFWWDTEGLEAEDVQVLVLQRDQQKQATLERARADVFGKESVDVADASRPRREPIAESVRHQVWRRDEGRCVDCGSRERLEFDHIIPVSQGGSNTARNLELRCEICNRRKAATI